MARTRLHTRRNPRSNPRGILSVHVGGFGFVQTAEGEYYVPPSKMNGAFDGDLVEVVPLPTPSGRNVRGRPSHDGTGADAHGRSGTRQPARVARVLDRAHDTLIGRYEVAEPFGVVVPEDARIPHDIFTMRADRPDIPDGALVRVRISAFPSRNTAATGVVEEIIGRADDEDIAIDLIVARRKLETSFSEGALNEADCAGLDEEGALSEGYRDLRDRFVFTIDPSDARDFDDAVSLDRVGPDGSSAGAGSELAADGGVGSGMSDTGAGKATWRLGVHIADVSYYVPWGCSIDLDARRRATSIYLVDRVIPMLPEALSNDLCSLKPGEVRRSLTADMYLDEEGRLVRYELYPALIRSKMRLCYDEAQEMLSSSCPASSRSGSMDSGCRGLSPDRLSERSTTAGRKDDSQTHGDSLSWRLSALSHIAKLRVAARARAGAIDFATKEAKVRLDGHGRPVAIDLRVKTDATSLIEEAMILANETVAAHLRDARFPSIYRVHERPSVDSLAALVPVFQEFSWFKDLDRQAFVAGDPLAVQAVLAAGAGRPESELVSSLVLRSMKRAVYKPECEPHYGLASEAYTHFTSPIRRYPDLVVHRMLRAQMTGRPERFDQEVASLAWIAEHSSERERVAEKAARESQEYKIIEYMERCIGQTFSAVISGVATYGVYVRLESTAEGLVHVKDLGREYFALDPVQYRLTGQDTGKSYHLGQRVSVVLTVADPNLRRLDFRPTP